MSMHEIRPERRSFGMGGHDGESIAKRPNTFTAEPYKSHSLLHYSTSNDLSKNATRSDHSISRSLSSSVSSYVGSMDDCDGDHHGVYSAYDVASRSPYSVLVHRRYSQSSLSSSSTSFNQSNPSIGYQTPKTSRESIHQSSHQGRVFESHDHYERRSFVELSPVSEGGAQLQSHWSIDSISDSKQHEHSFSSSYKIHLSKKPASGVSPPNVTEGETQSSVSQSSDLKPLRLNVTQAAEMSVSHNYSSICETYDGETRRATVKQVAAEASVIQRQSHASFDPTYDSESRKVLVTHATTEPKSNTVYQRQNRESHSLSLTQTVSVTARSVHKDKTEHKTDKSPSVKDLAKRFSGCYDEEARGDMRKVKAETWPKVVHVHDASFYDNDVEKHDMRQERTSQGNFYHTRSGSRDLADNTKRGTKNSYQRNSSRGLYENERDFKTDHLRGEIVNTAEQQKSNVVIVEMLEPKNLLDSETNDKTNNMKKTNSRESEIERPVLTTRQRLDFREPDDTDKTLNVLYRRKNSRDVNGIENGRAPRVPPRPKSFPAVNVSEPVVLRSEASYSTQGSVKSLDTDGISHRLSLQELIRLHEEQIAMHTRSAMASSHAQIYLKRPVLDLVPCGNSEDRHYDRDPGSKDQQREVEFARVCESDMSASKRSDDSSKSGEWRSSTSQYEIKEVQSADGTPIKVIELRDKKATSPVARETRERPAR